MITCNAAKTIAQRVKIFKDVENNDKLTAIINQIEEIIAENVADGCGGTKVQLYGLVEEEGKAIKKYLEGHGYKCILWAPMEERLNECKISIVWLKGSLMGAQVEICCDEL